MINLEEQNVINSFKELLTEYDRIGAREVRDGHSRVSLFGQQFRFDLKDSFPLFTHRQFFIRGIFEELMFFLRGQTDNKILEEKNVKIWSPWNGILDPENPTELGKIYGYMWRNFGKDVIETDHFDGETKEYLKQNIQGFDQISWVLNEIKTNPTSSRLIVTGWDPRVSTQTPKEAVLPCCHTLFQFFVKDMTSDERKNWLDNNYVGGSQQAITDYCNTGIDVEDEYRKEEIAEQQYNSLLDWAAVPKGKLSCQLYQRKLCALLERSKLQTFLNRGTLTV